MVPRFFFIVALSLAAICRIGLAHPIEIINSFSVTNYTGYVIASDAANADPDYNRDAIRTSAQIRYETTANSASTVDYQIVFRLLDQAGNPVQIRNENGVGDTAYTVNDSVTLPFTVIGITVKASTRNYGGPLVPINRLDPYQNYTAEVRLYEVPPLGRPTATGDVATDGPRRYSHFTNTSPSDTALNVITVFDSAAYNRSYLVKTDTDKDTFTVDANLTMYRYDAYNLLPASANVTLTLTLELRDVATDAVIPLADNTITLVRSIDSYQGAATIAPKIRVLNETLEFAPAAGVQLDSVNKTYKLNVSVSHLESVGVMQPGNSIAMAARRFLHFNGKLFFGAIETGFTSIANNPAVGLVVLNSHVTSTLSVDGNSGFIVGHPTHTYGSGAALSVRLRSNGNAELASGSVTVTGPSPDLDSVADIRVLRGVITLDTAGAHSDIIVALPTGFGYRLNLNSKILTPTVGFLAVPLNQALVPLADQTYTAAMYAAEETKPLWLEASSMTWKVAAGQFVLAPTTRAFYVREQELTELAAAPVAVAGMKIKRSNEQVFRGVDKVTSSQIVVDADANGNARLTCDLSFVAQGFRSHFPYDARISYSSGVMVIAEDLIKVSGSAMENVGSVTMAYNRDCNEVDCPGAIGPDTMSFKADDDLLVVTEDGGLTRPGILNTPKPLTWGWIATESRYAHQTETWTPAYFHMPGSFIRGDRNTKPVQFGPPVILFTGVLPANPANTERPGTPAYQDGFGDYAGLNFRVLTDANLRGESTLAAKPTGQYPLTGRSKYYIRQAGVSGIHEAVFGSFPSAILYGYPINFDNFGLAFLDTENVDSRTEGYITIPDPSDFKQNFEKLIFTCLGALDKAEVPSDEAGVMKELEYWHADFTTLAIDFMSDAACNPGEGYLVLGVAAWASHVDSTLYGKLGFRNNGNLITEADGLVSGVTSRLKLPNSFKLRGPTGQKYNFTPVSDAYYNNHDFAAPALPGWINIAGKMDVPFFEDLKVHMHTSARKDDDTAVINLMGGWPDHGFEIGAGNNFFTQSPFDTDNRGYPTGVTVPNYRAGNSDGNGIYLVRAQRNWLNVINFDYPLAWSSSQRSFKSFQPINNDLLVVNVEHQVKYLDAENAELTFGIEYKGMPKVNIANLAFNAIDEATGVAQAFVDAGLGPVRTAVDEGMKKMDEMLNDQMQALFKAPFDALLKPKIEAMYDVLKSNFDSTTHTWTVNPNTTITEWITGGGMVIETFESQINKVAGGISAGVGVIKEVDVNLGKVEDAISGIESILAESGGNRTIASQLIKKLVGQLAADFAGAFIDSKLNEFLAEADPTLDQIHSVLEDLKDVIGELRDALAVGSEFATELQDKVNDLNGEIHTVSVKVQNDVKGFFNGINLSVDDPFQHYSKQEVVDLVRLKLEDRFFASKVPTEIQVILKERIYDLDASIRESIDSVFQEVNGVIKGLISETLSELDNSINGMLGSVNDVMGAGKVNGYAHINNDALKLLRLDIYAQLKVPSEMELNAYIQIKELDSENFPTECLPAGGKATEVSVGATDVKVDWISPDLRASIGFKATFDPTPPIPVLLGIAGSFEMNGEVNFEAFKITYLAASMAFGAEENYFSCAARVLINKYEGFGGIYFGRTCTLDPIALWDPEVASVLGDPPFTGAYVYAEVWIPISEALLGIPATCFFNITAGVGAGAFYFVEGPTYGGKMFLGVKGELLCIVSVGGDIKLIGVKNPDGLTLKGSGTVWGEIGWCPFCISFDKTIGLQ